jgi:hypothetical protein
MGAADVLALYGQLAGTVARMVELARALQWAQLPRLDAHCTDLFVQLRDAQVPAGLSGAQRERLDALSVRIRDDQQALHALLRPQFDALRRRLVEGQGGR